MQSSAESLVKQATAVTTPTAGGLSAAGSFWGFLSQNAAALGVIIALISLIIHIWLGMREDRRRNKEHERWMKLDVKNNTEEDNQR